MLFADATEDMREGIAVGVAVGEVDAVIRQNRMQGEGHSLDDIAQELSCSQLVGREMELGECKFGRSGDGDEQMELALDRLHLGDINVEVANRIAFELLLGGFVCRAVGQPRDAMPLQATVQ